MNFRERTPSDLNGCESALSVSVLRVRKVIAKSTFNLFTAFVTATSFRRLEWCGWPRASRAASFWRQNFPSPPALFLGGWVPTWLPLPLRQLFAQGLKWELRSIPEGDI